MHHGRGVKRGGLIGPGPASECFWDGISGSARISDGMLAEPSKPATGCAVKLIQPAALRLANGNDAPLDANGRPPYCALIDQPGRHANACFSSVAEGFRHLQAPSASCTDAFP